MKILLITPPLTQMNTPYPATAYLTGFLKKHSFWEVAQRDLSLELILKVFSQNGLEEIFKSAFTSRHQKTSLLLHFQKNWKKYVHTIEPVISFLQGKNPTLAYQIRLRNYLPEGPRFFPLDEEELSLAFGDLGIQDQAKFLASLYLDDLYDLIHAFVDPQFGLSQYAEKIAASQKSFDVILENLQSSKSVIKNWLGALTEKLIQAENPDLVGLTIPFPGNLLGALQIAKVIKNKFPKIKIVLGGGYANTELRNLSEPRLFDFVDYVTLDAGEKPLLNILEFLEGRRTEEELHRTFYRSREGLVKYQITAEADFNFNETGNPSYDGLPIQNYVSLVEVLNPMHRFWSDGFWNKLTLAHGCYWKKCAFCDVSLDYIKRYEPAQVDTLISRIESLIKETGKTGFHFVDEAMPPQLLRKFSEELIRRNISIHWWGNIRFEKAFNESLCALMAKAGCIAVTGGLEVASDRLLKLMEKGVTISQVAQCGHHFSQNGIMVHAYLMYGFPTQTDQEVIDALEVVRQLFLEGCIQSAYWHRFVPTVHSPVGRYPKSYGVFLNNAPIADAFAQNDLIYQDPNSGNIDRYHQGLNKALLNFMNGAGFEKNLHTWFSFKIKDTQVPKDLIQRTIKTSTPSQISATS